MSIKQLDTLLPNSPAQSLQTLVHKRQKRIIKAIISYLRSISRIWKKQYFISDAFRDVARGINSNQDISLAVISLAAVLSFSLITLYSNIILTFMLDANYLAGILGANLVLVVFAAAGVMICSGLWLLSFIQNNISISIVQGINRKRKRSLVATLHHSLQHTPLVSAAIVMILAIALIPVITVIVIVLTALYILKLHLLQKIPYLAATGVLSLSWIVIVLNNLTLMPYAILFDHAQTLRDAITTSRQLVKNKGQWFIALSYLCLLIGLALSYGVAYFIQSLIGINTVLIALSLGFGLLFAFNTCLTMLYRKRRLAKY